MGRQAGGAWPAELTSVADVKTASLGASRFGFCGLRSFKCRGLAHKSDTLADDLGQVRQNQQQSCSEEDKPGLTYFRVFEHGDLPFFVIPELHCSTVRAHILEKRLAR